VEQVSHADRIRAIRKAVERRNSALSSKPAVPASAPALATNSSVAWSTWQAILVAACDALPSAPFTKEQLLVECWRRFPKRFSMDGYPQYPHSLKVWSKITGREPLRTMNLIVQVSESMYMVTPVGRRFRKKLPKE